MEPTTAPGPEAAEASEGSAPAAAPAARGGGAAGVRALRRPSFVPPNALEPLIVVEESFDGDEDDELAAAAAGPPGGEQRDRDRDESPSPPADDVNPYLLSPWRDTRKSSLPTPACASGITASQVRRLSERGPESGPSPREQEFLATLSAMPGPAPGGRRHSVVISRVPPPSLIMFGRGRRESIAAFSAAASRREALASSTHNLQLDLMDDLLEFKAAKKVKQLQEEARRWGGSAGSAGPSPSPSPSPSPPASPVAVSPQAKGPATTRQGERQ